MFYLFAGSHYYPEGGASDFKVRSNMIQNLRDITVDQAEDWWHIADETMIIVESSHGV